MRRLGIICLPLLVGCLTDSIAPESYQVSLLNIADNGRRGGLTVLTRNMYVGANVDLLIAALLSEDPNDDIPTLLTAIEVFQATDFPTRASAMADEILRTRPDVIGLQEVSRIHVDLTGLGIPAVIHQDFLGTLMAELAARGLQYDVAGEITNIQAAPFPGIDLEDRDVLLVDPRRVTVTGVVARNFEANIGPVAPGVTLMRGFVAADLMVEDDAITVATTHLESGNAPGIAGLRAAQAFELIQLLAGKPAAVVLGDLNDGPASAMYGVFVQAGYLDAWVARHPGRIGHTCCHADDLGNSREGFTQRLDYVLSRGVARWAAVDLLGELPSDRLLGSSGRIWPSDHAGLVADLVGGGGPSIPGGVITQLR